MREERGESVGGGNTPRSREVLVAWRFRAFTGLLVSEKTSSRRLMNMGCSLPRELAQTLKQPLLFLEGCYYYFFIRFW